MIDFDGFYYILQFLKNISIYIIVLNLTSIFATIPKTIITMFWLCHRNMSLSSFFFLLQYSLLLLFLLSIWNLLILNKISHVNQGNMNYNKWWNEKAYREKLDSLTAILKNFEKCFWSFLQIIFLIVNVDAILIPSLLSMTFVYINLVIQDSKGDLIAIRTSSA